ncbi:MAG TPA: hypothetical protein VGC76_00330 [Pyrinomonadaceae bacterium]|jgi:hypothetical protein
MKKAIGIGGKIYTDFPFREREKGSTAFPFFDAATKYFELSVKEFMINLRVENLFELLKVLRSEGNKIELREPLESVNT